MNEGNRQTVSGFSCFLSCCGLRGNIPAKRGGNKENKVEKEWEEKPLRVLKKTSMFERPLLLPYETGSVLF